MSADVLKEGLRVWTHNPLETSQVYLSSEGYTDLHRFAKALTSSFWSSGVSKVDLEESELTTLGGLCHFPSESAGVYRLAWVCQSFDLQPLVKWHIKRFLRSLNSQYSAHMVQYIGTKLLHGENWTSWSVSYHTIAYHFLLWTEINIIHLIYYITRNPLT